MNHDENLAAGALTIRHAQKKQPWTVPYSAAFDAQRSEMPHLSATHTVLHAAKSIGKIAAVFEDLDHSGHLCPSPEQGLVIENMAADLMTAALRFANLYNFDLALVLSRRVKEKNGVGYR